MTEFPYFIISDLHLGSEYSLYNNFIDFLETLPEKGTLILNGDVLHGVPLIREEEVKVLNRLVEESHRRPVFWVFGNNDSRTRLHDKGGIQFCREYVIGNRLLIMHGDTLDSISKPLNRLKDVITAFFKLLTLLGHNDKPMYQRAKKWPFFYAFFDGHIRKKAVNLAGSRGIGAVACGHTHYPAEKLQNKIQYFNTGSWLETPAHYLLVEEESITLKTFPPNL